MDLWLASVIVAAVGGFLLLTAFTLPALSPDGKSTARVKHVAYGLAAALLAAACTWLWDNDVRKLRAQRHMAVILEEHLTPDALVHAQMSFFETHRKVYPEVYTRVKAYCAERRCLEAAPTDEGHPDYQRRQIEIYEAAVMMRTTLLGLMPPADDDAGHDH